MSEYIPTTEAVRSQYASDVFHQRASRYAEFDAWLAAHDRQVAAQTLRDTADDLRGRRLDAPSEWADDVLREHAAGWEAEK